MEVFNALKTEAVVIPAEFINSYMAAANGDYVKVYLCLLLNGSADIEEIAEKLRLTEGDVKRAIRYWQDQSVLGKKNTASARRSSRTEPVSPADAAAELSVPAAAMSAGEQEQSLREKYRGTGCTQILNRLASDQEFGDLLLIAQKYLARQLTEGDLQVFAYLYDGLHLNTDVLDYLVAYSVEHDRTGIRYIEKLGTDWAEVGVRDVNAARCRVRQFEDGGRSKKGTRTAGRAEKPSEKTPATDYNELVMQELLQNMGG